MPGLIKGTKNIIPIKIKNSIKNILTVPTRIKFQLASRGLIKNDDIKKIAKLKNRHVGKRAFIIGSGPSIKEMDLSPLKNEITLGIMHFS